MANLNFLAIGVATLGAFMVGGLWFGPLFSKPWMAELGLSKENSGGRSMAVLFGWTLVLEAVIAFFLCHMLAHFGTMSLRSTMMISVGTALGFITPAICINYLYQGRSVKLMAIECGHWIAVLAVMGLVFGLLGT